MNDFLGENRKKHGKGALVADASKLPVGELWGKEFSILSPLGNDSEGMGSVVCFLSGVCDKI